MMNIILNGHAVKKVGELKVGESGYVPCGSLGVAMPREANPAFPGQLPPMGNCYRVTRVEGGLDVIFVPAVTTDARMEDKLIASPYYIEFKRDIDAAQADGWRVDAASLRTSFEHGFAALLHRPARDEG